MKTIQIAAAILTASIFTFAGVVLAEEMHHSQMDHSEMDMMQEAAASGKGVINSIDFDANSINITHDPMPQLGWPQMTMDLPVTRKVDLSNVKVGETVSFAVKLGRDKKYRVIQLSPVTAPGPGTEGE